MNQRRKSNYLHNLIINVKNMVNHQLHSQVQFISMQSSLFFFKSDCDVISRTLVRTPNANSTHFSTCSAQHASSLLSSVFFFFWKLSWKLSTTKMKFIYTWRMFYLCMFILNIHFLFLQNMKIVAICNLHGSWNDSDERNFLRKIEH